MWKRFFGPFAIIVGLDIRPVCMEYEEEQIHVRIGDQSDEKFLNRVIDEFGVPDIIIDDGSHIMSHVCRTFDFMYDKLNANGVYLVEDLHTAYWDDWEGGLCREGTFIEACKTYIDALNARYSGMDAKFANTTFSMCFYDSVVVFEKMSWPAENLSPFKRPMPEHKVFGKITFEMDENQPHDEKYDISKSGTIMNGRYNAVFSIERPVASYRMFSFALQFDEKIDMDQSLVYVVMDKAEMICKDGSKIVLNLLDTNGRQMQNRDREYFFNKKNPRMDFGWGLADISEGYFINLQAHIGIFALKR